jgi:hypothetical protein
VSRRAWQDHLREYRRSRHNGSSMSSGGSEMSAAEVGEVKWSSGRRNRRWVLFGVERYSSSPRSSESEPCSARHDHRAGAGHAVAVDVTCTNTISYARRSHPSTSLLHIFPLCRPLPRGHRAAHRSLCSRTCSPCRQAICSVQAPMGRARMDLYAPQNIRRSYAPYLSSCCL